VQALARVIRQTLNNPTVDTPDGPLLGKVMRTWTGEDVGPVARINLGSLLDAPGWEKIDLSAADRPGPVAQLIIAINRARQAVVAHPNAVRLQAHWRELISHRMYHPRFGNGPGQRSLRLRPVDETLLDDLAEAARLAESSAVGLPPPPPLNGITSPQWDRTRRRVCLGEDVLSTYTKEAKRQFALLDAIQAAGWPPEGIAPPNGLPVKDTVDCLNKKLETTRLRFGRLDNNTRVAWWLQPE
jgi:hypothetical protein